MSFQYTPGQLRSVISIAPETYRHWKKALAPLRRDRRQSPCFTAGDLIAVAVVRALCLEIGIRVGALAPIAKTLFEVCNASPWPVLERGKLVIDFSNAELRFLPELASTVADGTLVTVSLRTIVVYLREQLLTVHESADQQSLRFPPTPIGNIETSISMRGRS